MSLFDDLPEETSSKANSVDVNPFQAGHLDPTLRNDISSDSLKRKHACDTSADSRESLDVKRLRKDVIHLSSHAHGRKGEREEMQDFHVTMDDISDQLPEETKQHVHRLAYFGVFDGHAGSRASRHASENLHKIILEKFPTGNLEKIEKEIKKCLVESFKKTDDEFLRVASKQKPFWKDGTTATVVLVMNNTLYVANIGDSKAILCRDSSEGSLTALTLTKDHNPTLYEERMRIQKAGGTVRDGRVNGVLEVSRSIGDGQYKKLGVTCVPNVRKCQLTDKDRYVMIACDGLWKSFSNEDAVQYIDGVCKEAVAGSRLKTDDNWLGDQVCSRLSAEAIKRLSGDNVTVLFVKLKH